MNTAEESNFSLLFSPLNSFLFFFFFFARTTVQPPVSEHQKCLDLVEWEGEEGSLPGTDLTHPTYSKRIYCTHFPSYNTSSASNTKSSS